MIATLFLFLLVLLIALLVLLAAADHRVTRATNWESVDRWLLAGSYAAPGAVVTAGAVIGVALAWCVI